MWCCVDVFIVDDIILENESFDLTLERTTALDSRITLNPVNGVVEVTDNDGRYDNYWASGSEPTYLVVQPARKLYHRVR